MNVGRLATAAAFLIVALSSAHAQTDKDGPTLRDILNRAQTQSDRKAVEDLIGKLRGVTPAQPPAPAAPATPVSAPAAPAPAPAAPPATVATPAVTAPSGTPAATASAPPAPATTPAAPVAPASSASAPAVAPSAPEQTTVPPSSTFGTASSGSASAPAIEPSPSPASPAASAEPSATSPSQALPATASRPAAPASTVAAQPEATSTPAAAIAPVGAPIGPAEALPTPIAPSDADMARAPEIAREMGLPNVDIEVLFAYDSSEITPTTAESLTNLGRALTDPRLAGQRFVIAGHTDSRGTRAYNVALSDRRAQSVRQFLIEHFKIAPENLVARGFGKAQLKNPRNPRGPENRRVQIINWSGQTADQIKR